MYKLKISSSIPWFTLNLCLSLAFQETHSSAFEFESLRDCLTSAGVDGKNLVPRSTGIEYTELNFQWNTYKGYIQPLAYLVANNVSDVQSAVICSRKVKIRIVARSGGHSYVKNGFGDSRSLIVDLSKLNQITVDRKRMIADIEAGARNGRISYLLWQNGVIAAQGICPTVAIGGLALGGGYGYFTRQFGLVSDNIVEMEMVDAKGELLLINSSSNQDLFFALRGGGGGSYGIVIKYIIRVHPSPPSIVRGVYEFDFDDFPQIYEALQSFSASKNVANNINLFLQFKENNLELQITCINLPNLQFSGTTDVVRLLNSFPFPRTTKRWMKLMSQSEFILSVNQFYSKTELKHPSELANMTKHIHSGWKKVKSFYVERILSKNEIAELYEMFRSFVKYGHGQVSFEQAGGGAIDTFSKTETAFIHRGKNLSLIQLSVLNPAGTIWEDAELALKTVYEKSKVLLNHRESYQNYLDADIPDYLERYYGNCLNKLIQAKMRIDPDNVFHHPQSIPANFGCKLSLNATTLEKMVENIFGKLFLIDA